MSPLRSRRRPPPPATDLALARLRRAYAALRPRDDLLPRVAAAVRRTTPPRTRRRRALALAACALLSFAVGAWRASRVVETGPPHVAAGAAPVGPPCAPDDAHGSPPADVRFLARLAELARRGPLAADEACAVLALFDPDPDVRALARLVACGVGTADGARADLAPAPPPVAPARPDAAAASRSREAAP